MKMQYQIAEGRDDFQAFMSVWPEKFGPIGDNHSAQRLIEKAFRAGSAILSRDPSDNHPMAATILDFDSYGDALFVPFILIADAVTKRAHAQRRMLKLVLSAFEASHAKRLLFVTDDSKQHRAAVEDFNRLGAEAGLAAALEIVGHADDLYGDGRSVMFNQLFIPSSNRPDLTSHLVDPPQEVAASSTAPDRDQYDDEEPPTTLAAMGFSGGIAGLGGQILGDGLMAACCSGCGEKSGKEKEGKEKDVGKEGKEGGKEGKDDGKEGIERSGPSGKLSVENPGIFELYSQIGIKRFNRYAEERFSPLI